MVQATPAGHKSAPPSTLKVGMEVHVELATRSKMFTRSANVAHPDHYDAEPNSLVDPVVAALPGVLPVMNRAALEMAMMVGLALNCTIARYSKWDRKNYYYPDLPKGYQISQYDLPLCHDGVLEIPSAAGGMKPIRIIRAHLEEDTGKLGHELPGGIAYEGSLVDLNRAGTPLLEIVTQPDFDHVEDVLTFAQELRKICRFLGVTEGVMQRGHMRFEPNVNLLIQDKDGETHATPIVEIKNLNSFRALRGAVEYERRRQVEQWMKDRVEMAPGAKSTRGWDDQKEITLLQREKEEAHDYRYFPEPDLIPVQVDDAWLAEVTARVPELPLARRARYRERFGLDEKDAEALTDTPKLSAYYESCAVEAESHGVGQAGYAAAKLLLNAAARMANERGASIPELGVSPRQAAGLLALRERNEIGAGAVDQLFTLLADGSGEPREVAEAHGLLQVRDESQLDEWADAAIAAHPAAAEDVRAGKTAAIGRLVGHVMKLSQGQADAKAVNEKLREKLT